MQTKVLSREEIMQVIEMKPAIEAVENVYKTKSTGEAVVWPTTFYVFEYGASDMDIKSGYLPGAGIYGHKTVSFFADNDKIGLPNLLGVINVFDAKTGFPIGILEGAYITGIRTGAAGAIGAKYLARKDSETLFILGAGNQAAYQIAAMLIEFPSLKKVFIADMLDSDNAVRFAGEIRERLKDELSIDAGEVEFEATDDPAHTVPLSDVIITVTPARNPVIKREWISPGTHLSCIGADAEGKEEIDPEIFENATVFVDQDEYCIGAGEVEIPIKKGILKKEDICGEIGDLILGKVAGRKSDEEITIFDATGIALLDIATAKVALELADKKGLGTAVKL